VTAGPVDPDSEWQRKGATISDKTALKEYGLARDEIVRAIRTGKIQYRVCSMHGNPWLRLLRRQVELLARTKYGDARLKDRKARTELGRVTRELKRLKAQVAELEKRKSLLEAAIGRR